MNRRLRPPDWRTQEEWRCRGCSWIGGIPHRPHVLSCPSCDSGDTVFVGIVFDAVPACELGVWEIELLKEES